MLDDVLPQATYLAQIAPQLFLELQHSKMELSKFRKKKLKPVSEKYYPLIDAEAEKRKAKGLGENYTEIIENIGIDNKLSTTERKKLYTSYMKHKNRRYKNSRPN